ncbi:MAG: heme exporter protein CcmD [Acidimicrobiaceae bacterium]|nr:heme exporter protein CcmD [Acidimicrobiaceae bacterium]MYH00959.1 heme exporter protein CcmD [Acidimicrobiaceae bacterium]MYL03322.1 heme exporter protein CcmD [Acidimicrobiaceae bacterium]
MSHAAYVLSAWGVTVAAVAVYTASLRLRGQRLLRRARAGTIDSAGTDEE